MSANTNEVNKHSSLKYICCACIAGAAAKLYDDIEDNFRVGQFKTAHNMEFLKGVHYITLTMLGISRPLIFIVAYICAFINKYLTPSSFELPYENSLFYSFAFLFLFLDYSKINAITNDEFYFITCVILGMSCEEIYDYISKRLNKNHDNGSTLTEEVSHKKLWLRFTGIIVILFVLFKFELSSNIKYFILYLLAYLFVSCCTQFYSLYIYKPQQPIEVPPIIEEKKEENVEQTEIKEDTEPPIITSVSQV